MRGPPGPVARGQARRATAILNTIRLCSDDADDALRAAHVAAELATKLGSQLVLVNAFMLPVSTMLHLGGPDATPCAAVKAADLLDDTWRGRPMRLPPRGRAVTPCADAPSERIRDLDSNL